MKDDNILQIIEDLKATHPNDLWLEVYTLCSDDFMLLRKEIMKELLKGQDRSISRCSCQEIYNEIFILQNEPKMRRTK